MKICLLLWTLTLLSSPGWCKETEGIVTGERPDRIVVRITSPSSRFHKGDRILIVSQEETGSPSPSAEQRGRH